jgi:hypothetical protein
MVTTLPIEYETIDQAVEKLFAYLTAQAGAESYPLSKDGQMPGRETRLWLSVHKITLVRFAYCARKYGLKFSGENGTYTFAMDWQVFHVPAPR